MWKIGAGATGLAIGLVVALAGAPTASAATCSDYSNQAAAQRAKDTLDGDGDGIYCEALPCPCLKPGSGGGGSTTTPSRPPRRRPSATSLSARIIAVIDGDTVRVRTSTRRSYTVRLIGIDTPETRKPGTPIECGGKEATSSMYRLAFSAPRDANADGLLDTAGGLGRQVRLTTDPTQAKFDRYRRLLAYVRTSGGELNYAQVAAGWGKVYVFGRAFRELSRLRAAETGARTAGRGVWGPCGGNFHRAGVAAAQVRPVPVRAAASCSRRAALLELRRRHKVPRRGRYRLSERPD